MRPWISCVLDDKRFAEHRVDLHASEELREQGSIIAISLCIYILQFVICKLRTRSIL